jgi:hypothetical protein
LLLFIIILERRTRKKYKVEKDVGHVGYPPKYSIIKVKYKKFGGKPTWPASLYTRSYTAYIFYTLS